MRVQDHIATLSWTAADKALFILYGFVLFFQIRQLAPTEYGLFAELIALHSFIFGISDGFALQGIIKFGADIRQRGAINRLAFLWHMSISLGIPILIFTLQVPLSLIFDQPRFPHIATYLILYSMVALPRLYCIKFLSRDIRMRDTFIANALWFGTMAILTFVLYLMHGIKSFEDMLIISFTGMAVSSLGTVLLTWKTIEKTVLQPISFRDFSSFGSYQVSSWTIGNLVKQLDILLIEYFFPTATVGIYSSAKQLFRTFEQIFEAIAGLIYTGGVRLVHQNRSAELLSFVSKATSFSFIAMLIIVVPIELGLGQILITWLLSAKYANAIEYFQILSLAALALPFSVLSLMLVVYNRLHLLLLYTCLASIMGMIALVVVSIFHIEYLVPIGLIVYYFILGALCYRFVHKQLGLSPRMLARAVPDTIQFAQQLLQKRQKP